MRFLSLLIAVSLTGTALAQTAPTTETRIRTMLQRLRERAPNPLTNVVGFDFIVSGIDRTEGGPSKTIGAELFYRYDPYQAEGRALLQANLVDFVNGVKVSEMVADGKTLWTYNGSARTYSASPYDQLSPAANVPQSTTYLQDGLFGLNRYSGGTTGPAYATRLLYEIVGGPTGAAYRSWMPGVLPVEVGTPYRDPITGLYRNSAGAEVEDDPGPVDNVAYLVYASGTRRAIAFELYIDPDKDVTDPDREVIQRIYVSEASTVNKKRRFVTYSIVPAITADFSRARFAPYDAALLQGWAPIVAPSPIKQ